MDLLAIKAAEPEKYALSLMEALFTDSELAISCYSSTTRSTKTPLSKEKVALLEGTVTVHVHIQAFLDNTSTQTNIAGPFCSSQSL